MTDDRAVLVIGPAWVGDMVMAQCLLSAIKDLHPDAPIDVVAPRWGAALLARMPQVRRWLDAPFPRRRLGLLARARLGWSLRGRYAAAYVLPGSWKSALLPVFAGVPRRIGYTREARFGLLNERPALPRDVRRRTADAFFRLAGGGRFTPPRLAVDRDNQRRLLEHHGLMGRPFAAFMPGAEFGPAKRWPARHYAALAVALASRGWAVALLGSPQDAAAGAAVAGLAPGVVDLCGQTRLEDAVDLLAAATVAVTNDSGLMHVAAAVGTPVVAVYGSTSPADTPPLIPRAAVVTRALPCAPCHARTCRFGHTDCLEGLEVSAVLEALDRLIAPAP